jgi:hypothetical protein
MPFQPPGGGLNNTAEYMTSGLPWVSASIISSGSVWQIDFPYVTSHLRIHLDGGNNATLAFGFTRSGSLGSNKNFLTATSQNSDTFSEHLRTKTLYIVAHTNNVTASVLQGVFTVYGKKEGQATLRIYSRPSRPNDTHLGILAIDMRPIVAYLEDKFWHF